MQKEMKKAFLLILGISLLFSNLQAQNWEELTLPTKFDFVVLPFNTAHIYAKGDKIALIEDNNSSMFLSLDKAKTWTELSYPNFKINAIFDFNGKLYLGDEKTISSSSDNGKTWKAETVPFATYNQFLEANNTLYAASAKGILQYDKATNKWTTIAFSTKEVKWLGESQGVIFAGFDGANTQYSTDNGKTWKISATAFFDDKTTGFATSGNLIMSSTYFSNYRTSTDKGQTWTSLSKESHAVTAIDNIIYGAHAFSSTKPLGVFKYNIASKDWEDFTQGNSNLKYAYALFNNGNGELFALCDIETDPTKKSNYKLYKAKVGKGVGAQTTVLNDSQVKVHPNPTDNFLNIECKDAIAQSYQLTDLQGKIVLEDKMESNQEQINISGIGQGIYFLKIHCKEGIRSEKILKR
jgi:photosystem II stability/assembly factor-like uncharacterized protein